MSALTLRLDRVEMRLSDTAVHYLWTDHGRLRIGVERPDQETGFGHLVSEFGTWWLHTHPRQRPSALRLNGRSINAASLEVDGVPELTLDPPERTSEPETTGAGRRQPKRHDPSPHPASSGPHSRVGHGPRRPEDRGGGSAGRTGPKRVATRRKSWVIGRVGTGADIAIDDPLVRAEHARLEVDQAGRWWVTEASGRIVVDGARAMSAVLDEGKIFVVGQTAVTVSPKLLAGGLARADAVTADAVTTPTPDRSGLHISAGRGLSIDVNGVTVRRRGSVLLDDVDLHVRAGEVVAVVGPSGAGKSSLIKVLLGVHQPDRGSVIIGGARPGGDRRQVRYVPQSESDDLYPKLTVVETLTFAARFRATRDTSRPEIDKRVNDALSWLGLQERRHDRIETLSGGQRRRVSIGTELVGLPQLLLLDEPTSGLDLGKDRDIMSRLRKISREFHCTVVVVTHSVTHLEFVDQLVVMARGGRVWYAGPPVAPATQGHPTWADWLVDLDTAPRRDRVDSLASQRPATRRSSSPVAFSSFGLPEALSRQAILVARRGWRSLAMLCGLPVIGTGLAILASENGLRPGPSTTQVLSILVTVAALTGAALTYLDLVYDRNVLRRDWRVGISASKLVLAKACVHGMLCLALAALITVIYGLFRDLPPPALGITPALLLYAAVAAVMISSMGVGLLVSSLADSLEQAVTYNTLLAVLQVALNGALFQVPLWCTMLLPTRLGLGTVASYSDLNRYRTGGLHHDTLWERGVVWVPFTLLGMALLVVWAVLAASWRTERSWRV